MDDKKTYEDWKTYGVSVECGIHENTKEAFAEILRIRTKQLTDDIDRYLGGEFRRDIDDAYAAYMALPWWRKAAYRVREINLRQRIGDAVWAFKHGIYFD